MQIVSGTCVFVIAVILLAYVPGKLLLIVSKRKVSPLEDVTLACFLGLIVSAVLYWLMMFAHQGRLYLLWPLVTGGLCVWILASKRKLSLADSAILEPLSQINVSWSRDKSALALAGVVAVGIIALAYLPFYYTNFTWQPDGTMHVYPLSDVLFHVAIANELTHTVPPQAPLFAGHALSYHYGMDVVAAMFQRTTGLNTRDLTVRFVPTLFLTLTMFSVFCFSRTWLRSGYFGALAVFLVFFGEDFSFIPGMLLGQHVDWSLRYFSAPPAVLPLFFTNPILPGVGLLFAALFCLQRYLQDRSGAWLFLTALLLVGLVEVKIFIAAQIMFSLGVAAVLYLVLYRSSELFKVAACTAVLTVPLIWPVVLKNKSEADVVMKFEPGVYISQAMKAIGMKDWLGGWLAFVFLALPIYIIGSLGLRVIGIPAIFKAIFRPNSKSALRFTLALFVLTGLLIALLFTITPAGWSFGYNPVSGTFLVQSKYVAWLFAVEVFQTLYRWVVTRGIHSPVAATAITAVAIAISVPTTVQHFIFWRNPDNFFGNGKPFGKQLQSFDRETLAVTDFLIKDGKSGDVVLCQDELLPAILALTNCRVPLGYFGYASVARSDYTRRESQVKEFWKDWQLGNVQHQLLREAGVRYIVVRKASDGLPATVPETISNVFENSEFAVFKVNEQRLNEIIPHGP